jgi:hypothetical protein
MAQHDYVLDNQGFGAMRSDLNLALAAIASGNSGNTAPSTVYPGLAWLDTSGTPWLVKQYNGTQWVTLYSINATTHQSDIVRGGTDSKLTSTTALASILNLQAITYAAATAITAAATTDITNTTDNIDLAGSAVTVTAITAPAALIGRRIRVRVTGSNITVTNGGGITVPNGVSASFNAGDVFTLVITAANTVRIEGVVPASIQSFYGFKNRIINGAMVIDQRNGGASVALTSSAYVLDRFLNYLSGSGRYSVQRVNDAPSGFFWSSKITVTTAVSPAATDYYAFAHPIEGFNVADLGFGAAGASPITLQFWVKSSLTGTFGGYLSGGQGFAFNYNIAAANTWEYKTVTIPGSVTGTWPKDHTLGLIVGFDLGTGTTGSISATGAWQTANPQGVTGATKLIATNGATWQITGLQLEKGSVASIFDYRPYGLELNLCQRYCWQTNSGISAAGLVGQSALTQAIMSVPTVVTMRVAPTLTNIANGAVDSVSSVLVNGLIPDTLYPHSVRFAVTSASNIGTAAGQAAVLRGQVIRLDAEL